MQRSMLLFCLLVLLMQGCCPDRYRFSLQKGHAESLRCYPDQYTAPPALPSPLWSEPGRAFVLLRMGEERYTWLDATVENGHPFDYKSRQYGKGNQLQANAEVFPTLARKGVHTTRDLRNTKVITGRSVSRITVDGRPWGSSGVGFMAEDETIMSVLLADNRTVKKLRLTHPDLGRLLFHLWNIAREMERYRMDTLTGDREQSPALLYHGKEVRFKITGSRGWQESIFNDEILGTGHIEIWREQEDAEQVFLKEHYGHLSADAFAQLEKSLFYIHTGEMVFFYINRYGFYEGHTEYRADPLAVALIFGLRSIKQVHRAAGGDLYQYFATHFTQNPE